MVWFVFKLHNGDDRLLVSVDNLTRHDGGEAAIEPRESTHLVDPDSLSDMKVGQSQCSRVERVTVPLLSRPRRDVDDPGLDDQVGGVDAARQRHLIDGDDLAVAVLDRDDDVSHRRLLPSSSRRMPPASVWRARLRVISYITRDEVSTVKA